MYYEFVPLININDDEHITESQNRQKLNIPFLWQKGNNSYLYRAQYLQSLLNSLFPAEN